MSNLINHNLVIHGLFICILCILALPNIRHRINDLNFKKQIKYDMYHFLIYQSIFGAYVSYLAIFYIPILISREIAGLLNITIFSFVENLNDLPRWTIIVIYFLYWDFLAYVFHRICHKIEFLWKIHKYHHSAIYFTGFTAYRVSFIENGLRICFYTALLLPVINQIAAPPTWIGYILVLFSFSKHSEFFCTKKFEWWPKFLIQSPRMHWVHHSLNGPYGKNFAEVFSFWDVIFKTVDYSTGNKIKDFDGYKIGVRERSTPSYYGDCIDILSSLKSKNQPSG
jgi:sterol desaturase/sphingolipid hydroxylase (fatty acid hydroxylase superfamily)